MREIVTVSMSTSLKKRLSRLAKKRHVKRSELVRDLLEESLTSGELDLPELTADERFILDSIS